MTNREAWENVAQAAKWLAEGREVEGKSPAGVWKALPIDEYGHCILTSWDQYRLKPEPAKPREWDVFVSASGWAFDCRVAGTEPRGIVRVREVLE